jgi:hypothetical protein
MHLLDMYWELDVGPTNLDKQEKIERERQEFEYIQKVRIILIILLYSEESGRKAAVWVHSEREGSEY